MKNNTPTQVEYEDIKESMLEEPDVPSIEFPLGVRCSWTILKGMLEEDGFIVSGASHERIVVSHSAETKYVSAVTKTFFSRAKLFSVNLAEKNIDKIKFLLEKQGYCVQKVDTHMLQVWPKKSQKPLVRSAEEARTLSNAYATILTGLDKKIEDAGTVGEFSIQCDQIEQEQTRTKVFEYLRSRGYMINPIEEKIEISWKN